MDQRGRLGKSLPFSDYQILVKDPKVHGLSQDVLLGLEFWVATISMAFIAYFLSCMALITFFYSKDVSSGSRDSTGFARHALSTFATNSIESLSMCTLRVSSSARLIILSSASSWSTILCL